MENETQTQETLSEGEIVYRYKGPIYNRPIGRGICLIDTEPEQYLEYAVDGGEYYMEVVIRKLPETYKSQG